MRDGGPTTSGSAGVPAGECSAFRYRRRGRRRSQVPGGGEPFSPDQIHDSEQAEENAVLFHQESQAEKQTGERRPKGEGRGVKSTAGRFSLFVPLPSPF